MCRYKNLRLSFLKTLDEDSLPIGFESAFDFIDERDWSFTLILRRYRQGSKASRSGSPACQR